ncbi:hypothetical protein [Azospirillum sp. B4]|uniref:hypothetical protein n=1 Tax=Azospirillum sp. B4 TaxID=95605 RepID=UPI00034A9EDE|nr:hypothetical protein [Azospirillum sp. B4]
MPETLALKLTVYQPAIVVDSAQQVGFEYDLTVVVPDLKSAVKGRHTEASAARCDVVPVTGTLSFPNPAAPVISPFTGVMFIYDNAPAIGFPLTLIAQSVDEHLKFDMTLAFPAPPLYFYSGAIQFGTWPGPLSNLTASFLCPQPV